MKRIRLTQLLASMLLVSATMFVDVVAVQQVYKQLVAQVAPINRSAIHTRHPHIPLPDRARTQGYSTNWSGFVAEDDFNNPGSGTVTAVSGSWIVPSVRASSMNTYSSIWVGIDGYSSSTVEQIGTEHDWYGGTQHHYAWFEMYPGASYRINNFPLKVGDVISASVVYSGDNVYTMVLTNQTQNISVTIPTQYTTSSAGQRSCAEWVVEAPYLNRILPLTNFGTVYLWGCQATINNVSGPINNQSWQNSDITMVTKKNIVKAAPSALLPDGGSFFVVWNHN